MVSLLPRSPRFYRFRGEIHPHVPGRVPHGIASHRIASHRIGHIVGTRRPARM
ncbi:hypothetical protein [Streptomyces purpureus]|uniref:hypothetical protein n=1 Tax=Streptomyces purpureus TaxID=1951 RepID=UPI001319BA90|nr:hypothetical protein [Streptomyces purpureus]